MTQNFPFTKANAIGWSPGQKITSVQINTVDANAAQAADGNIWSDAAVVKNWQLSSVAAGGGTVVVWEPQTGRWINASQTGGNPTGFFSTDGKEDWVALTIPAGTNWQASVSIAANGAGGVILGGSGGSATASKIRQSIDGGASWNARNTNASSTERVTCAVWHALISKYIIGLNSTASTNIETSTDGATWVQITGLPNTNARGSSNQSGAASNGTIVVMLSSVSTNKCITSTDGATWTERTLPATGVWSSVAWNSRSGKFLALGIGLAALSSDGITWTSVGLSAPFATGNGSLTAYSRAWVAIGSSSGLNAIAISLDDAVTWRNVKSLAAAYTGMSSGDNQVVAVGVGVAYATVRAGL